MLRNLAILIAFSLLSFTIIPPSNLPITGTNGVTMEAAKLIANRAATITSLNGQVLLVAKSHTNASSQDTKSSSFGSVSWHDQS